MCDCHTEYKATYLLIYLLTYLLRPNYKDLLHRNVKSTLKKEHYRSGGCGDTELHESYQYSQSRTCWWSYLTHLVCGKHTRRHNVGLNRHDDTSQYTLKFIDLCNVAYSQASYNIQLNSVHLALRVSFSESVTNLGVTIDSQLSMSDHVASLCRACFFQLRQLRTSDRHLPLRRQRRLSTRS